MIDPFGTLEARPIWVAWREEVRGSARAKPTKVPYDPNASGSSFGYGSSTDPATWGTHAQAEARARQLDDGRKVGCGTVLGDLGDDTYLGGADLDSSLDENGALAPWAVRIVAVLQTYAEVSPSGRGLKTFFRIRAEDVRWFLDLISVETDAWGCKRGIPGLDGANHGPGIEIYTSERYFTVTGRIWSVDHPDIVTLDREQLVALAELIPAPAGEGADRGGSAGDTDTSGPGTSAPRNSRDSSRSARAARIAVALMPDTYEEMTKGLRNHASDDIRAWVQDKGEAHNERELKRIWERIVAARASARQAGLADLEERAGATIAENTEPNPADAPPPPSNEHNHKAKSSIRSAAWKKHLLLNDKRKPRAVLANATIALRQAPEWDAVIRFDEFHNHAVLRGSPPWSQTAVDAPWSDYFDSLTTEWMQHQGLFVRPETVGRAVWTVAQESPFHPVREYLERCRWDGTNRLDTWATTYLGVPDTPYSRAVGARWMISGVARIKRPGCKADCALILEGPQGYLKSTVLRVLADPWFTDDIGEFGTKDAAQQLAGVWIIELSELDSYTRGDVSRAKSFISRGTDRFRPPYGTHPIALPRQCIFGGTVNHNEYLRDETGGRRFWPIACTKINIDALAADRDQLWAEARDRFLADEKWWLDTSELNAEASREQQHRYQPDAWDQKIWKYVETLSSVAIDDILENVLKIEVGKWSQTDQNRVARSLRALKWTRRQKQVDGDRTWRYFRPDPEVKE